MSGDGSMTLPYFTLTRIGSGAGVPTRMKSILTSLIPLTAKEIVSSPSFG